MMAHTLTDAARKYHAAQGALKKLLAETEKKAVGLRQEIKLSSEIMALFESGLDYDKINRAEHVVHVSDLGNGATERRECIADAIKQFATGKPENGYQDLWTQYFGTKNYAHWRDQRVNCEYFMGPRHGSVVFRVETTAAARKRSQADLTPDEVEAAIYYLTRIEDIQKAKASVKAA